MEARRLGNTDLEITRLGFGAWAIGGDGWAFGWGPQDDGDSVAAIHCALDRGVNWIDTAAIYGLGRSERVIARALKDRATKPYVFTKGGLVPDAANMPQRNLTAASLEREIEDSLRRLEVDVIDLYYIHWPVEDDAGVDEAWEVLAKAKRAGKVRWIAVSNFNVAQLKRCHRRTPVSSLQPSYSLLDRTAESTTFPFCQAEGIGVTVYSPMYSGLLTGKMTRDRVRDLPADDWRLRNVEFQSPRLERNLRLADVLTSIGHKHGVLAGEVAVAWTLTNSAVTGAIVGARSAAQVDGIFGAATLRLDADDRARIARFLAEDPQEAAPIF